MHYFYEMHICLLLFAEKPLEDKTVEMEATPISTLDLMWTRKKFDYDSSDSEKEEDAQDVKAASKKRYGILLTVHTQVKHVVFANFITNIYYVSCIKILVL